MKSCWATWLILLGTTAWLASTAQAQSGSIPEPLPTLADAEPGSAGAPSSGSDPGLLDSSGAAFAGNPAGSTPDRSEFSRSLQALWGQKPACGGEACQQHWYAYTAALVMTRNRAPAFWTTHSADDTFNLLMNSQDASAGFAGGGQLTLGYAWGNSCGPKLAFTYWALASMTGSASVTDQTGNPATALSSTIDFSNVTLNGTPATQLFDNAQQQALWRRDRTDNFEVNLQSPTYTGRSFQIAGLLGFRYFHFADNLLYGSASFGSSFSSNGGADAGYLNIRTQNNLFGAQLGATMNSILTQRLTVFAIPKIGLFGNQMNNLTQAYAGNAVNAPDINYATHKSDASVLSELDVGCSYAFLPAWRLTFGYRLVSVTNLSLADNQFAAYNHVEQSGSLILHGAFVGLGWMF